MASGSSGQASRTIFHSRGASAWRDEKSVLNKLRVHPDFVAPFFPPLAKGRRGGWPRHDQSQGLPTLSPFENLSPNHLQHPPHPSRAAGRVVFDFQGCRPTPPWPPLGKADLWPQLFSDVSCIALWISSDKILTRLYSILHWFHKRLEVNVKNPRENQCFQTIIVLSFDSFDNLNKYIVLWKIAARLITVSTSVNKEMWVKLSWQGGEKDRSLASSVDRAQQKHASRNRPSSTVNINFSSPQPRPGLRAPRPERRGCAGCGERGIGNRKRLSRINSSFQDFLY